MRKSLILLLAVPAFFMNSCTKSSLTDDFVDLDILTISETITTDVTTRAGLKQPIQINMTASYSISDDKIISAKFIPVTPELDADVMNEAIHSTLVKELGPDYYDFNKIESYVAQEGNKSGGLGACLNDCNKNYEKHQGRGNCKFDCWVDFTKKVIKFVAENVLAIEKFKDIFG